jgi:iron complex outermembrane receptor protein
MSIVLRILTHFTIVLSIAVIGLAAHDAHAQETDSAPDSALLEEVTVTARRREESLQDTPISITAFTGEALERQQIERLNGIASATPNLIFDSGATFSGANSSASVFIRGIGQVDFSLTTEPGVGIYLDGVYLSQTIGSVLDLVDVERVEVLRGPQGTLFGRNTIGGAINVTSRKPDNSTHGDIEVTTGRFSRFDVRGSINFPISDTLFVRGSALTANRNGFVEAPNTPSGDALGDFNQDVAQLALRFVPNDKFTADLTADYSSQDESGVPSVLAGVFDGASLAFIASLADPASPFYVPPPGPLPPPSFLDLHNILATVPLGQEGCLPPSPFTPPFCPPDIVPSPVFGQPTIGQADVIDIENDSLRNLSTLGLSSETDTWGVGLTLAYDMEWATIKSITSFRHMEAFTAFDIDATQVTIGDLVDDFDVDQFSQELQLSGLAMDGRLNWQTGFYYFNEDGLNLDDVEFTPVRILSGAKIDNDSVAGFGQLTFAMNEKLSLTAGIRYTDETKRFIVPDTCFALPKGPATLFDGSVVNCAQLQTVIDPKFLNEGFLGFVNFPIFPDDLPNPNARLCCLPISDADGNVVGLIRGLVAGDQVMPRGTAKRSFDDWTPHLNIAYKWTDDLMTYVSYSEGFKSGGFVQRVFPPKSEVPFFRPETARVYELGFKWSGAGERMRLNGAIFHTDYQDLQIEVNDGIAPVTRNAAEADIEGFELELTAIPADGWLIQAGVGYLDAEYTSLDPDENFTTDLLSLSLDSKLVNTPEWSGNLGVQYTLQFTGGSHLISRADLSYIDDHFKDALNFPQLHQDSYSLINAYITYVSDGNNWEVSLFGKNLTDEKYIVSGFANGLTQGRVTANLGRPREWGLALKYRFGE